MQDKAEATGTVVIELRDKDGKLKDRQVLKNLITDAGDLYHCTRIASAVAPAAPADATKVTGMKLGTGTTAVAKNGAGAALVTYLAGSNKALDATYPQVASLGAGLGYTVTYQCTFGAGVATNGALTEVVLVNDSATDATSTAANTVARVVFTATPKASTDVLTISWQHKQLGS
jgi:hypothetical protein